MIRTIAGTARISTMIIKDGSVAGRDAYAQKLENRFYNGLEARKRIRFNDIGRKIHEILPTKLIQVEKLPDEGFEYSDITRGAVILAKEVKKTIPKDVVGYILALKPNCKKEQFGGVSIEVLMHEIHHLFNYLTHPKIPNRIYKISKIPTESENFEKVFVEYFQSPARPDKCKKATEKLLEKENNHKVDILQYFRYKLIDEIGAYNTGYKFADLYRSKQAIQPPEYEGNMIESLYLREKLDFVTNMLKKTLQTERENLRNVK